MIDFVLCQIDSAHAIIMNFQKKSYSVPKSSDSPWNKVASFIASFNVIYSASIVDNATVDYKIEQQLTGAWENMNTISLLAIDYPKMVKDKSSNACLISTWSLCFELKRSPRISSSVDTSTQAWVSLRLTRVWGNSASQPMWVWVTPRSKSSASLSNLVLHFRRGSEKPCVSLQTRVWATPCFERLVSTKSNVRSASSVRPVFLL